MYNLVNMNTNINLDTRGLVYKYSQYTTINPNRDVPILILFQLVSNINSM